jgi:hypothetical protein
LIRRVPQRAVTMELKSTRFTSLLLPSTAALFARTTMATSARAHVVLHYLIV